jgi:hypothetical protein
MIDYTGRWFSTFGPLELTQKGDRVEGFYTLGGEACPVQGRVKAGRLTFTYREPTIEGEGWFEQRRPARFVGRWRPRGGKVWMRWDGVRGFEGVWNSSFGSLRLIQEAERVLGFYEGQGPSSLEGQIEGDRLTFRYREPRAGGEGQFELAPGGESFEGRWKEDGKQKWAPWLGRRIHPHPARSWLVVLEAYWQRSLADDEFSFGAMLREFFGRLSSVEVRHRFFENPQGLLRWLRELLYLPEPVALVLAAHGTEEGLWAGGEPIDSGTLVEALRHADNVLLLHFSACLMMKGQAGELARALQRELDLPVSGYTTSVDWAGSALIEFHLLDMILGRGLSPEDAARQLGALLGYAGDRVSSGSPYPPAGFRIFHAEKR